MNLSKKILRAINEGVINALSFDDEDFDAEDDMQLLKVSALYDIDRHNKMAEKIYYLDRLEELIPDPMEITKEAIDQATKWYELHGALYNPHLDGDEFKNFVNKCIIVEDYNWQIDLNWIDTSEVTNMQHTFQCSKFNGDISNWDVSNVTDMSFMFEYSRFDGDISKWDVSSVTDMQCMFNRSEFNGDISKWDVSSVINMRCMFLGSLFKGNISNWDVSSVTNMFAMFAESKFNGDISNWDVSNVKHMGYMFSVSRFIGDISRWNIDKVENIGHMYDYCHIKEEHKPKYY